MATQILQQVRRAVGNLNPQDVRNTSERPLAIRLVASSDKRYAAIEDFLSPPTVSRGKRLEQKQALFRADDPAAPEMVDLEIHDEGGLRPAGAFVYVHDDPGLMVRDILERKEDLGLPLARYFGPFRGPVTERTIAAISRENAIFSLMTALPNIAPSLIQLPWSVAEIGSDTAFLTVNQIRMLFLLAGASDRPIGYREQRAEIASVIAGAFGWRAAARELAGKIPFGGGLIPKAAVAYAGTYAVGKSAERLYRIGYGYSREERKQVYGEALQYGKKVAKSILDRHRAGKDQQKAVT